MRPADEHPRTARRLTGDDRVKAQRAAMFHLEGLEQQEGGNGRTLALFRESSRIDRHPSNRAYAGIEAPGAARR